MRFTKLQGAGNDFIFVNQRPLNIDQIKKLCDRHFGIGADGVVLVNDRNPMSWDFYNADGTSAEMCGNAARCMCLFLSHIKINGPWIWSTAIGQVQGKLNAKCGWSVTWPMSDQEKPMSEKFKHFLSQTKAKSYDLFVTGVPHIVMTFDQMPSQEFRNQWSPQLRHHPELDKSGANITWLALSDFETVTFERGVEGETLACGSGALAAFLTLKKRTSSLGEHDFKFPGGTLNVSQENQRLWLSGPAQIVFEGEITL